MKRLIAALVLLLAPLCGADTVRVYDLGVAGKTTPVDVEALAEQNRAYIEEQPAPDFDRTLQIMREVKPDGISHKTEIPTHTGEPTKQVKKLKHEVHLPKGTKMLFFTSADKIPSGILEKVNYGYCLGFYSLQDILDWREGKGADFPIQPLLNDKVCEWLGITALPALITVKGIQIEIQQGF